MDILRYDKVKVNVYPKDPQKVDKRGFYIRIYYGKKQRIDRVTKKPLYDSNGTPLMTTDKEERYLSDYEYYPDPKNENQRIKNKHVKSIAIGKAEEIRTKVRNGTWKRGGVDANKLYLMNYMINDWLPKKSYERPTIDRFNRVYKEFLRFMGRDVFISELDSQICRDFYHYLQTRKGANGNKLSNSSYKGYMKSFKLYLAQIFKGNIVDRESPANGITVGKATPNKTKVFLELHELQMFEDLDTVYKPLQRAYLFASYSAITKAELKLMKYGDFSQDKENDRWYVNVVRQKTKKPARLGLSKKAMSFMLPLGKPTEMVFHNKFHNYNDQQLKKLMLDAGITKQPITFHTSKNNFAVMYYRHNNGGNIGLLMKHLQHKDISTTQRYLAGLLDTEDAGGGSIDFDIPKQQVEINPAPSIVKEAIRE